MNEFGSINIAQTRAAAAAAHLLISVVAINQALF
jgi:hypothetical protein